MKITSIKNRFLLGINYFLYCLLYFVLARLIFLTFHFSKTNSLEGYDVLKTFLYGLRMDLSATSYIVVLPFLLLLFSIFIPKKTVHILLKTYSIFIFITINLFLLIDVVLYKSWGVRIDSTLLNYINTPKMMLASISTKLLITGTLAWITLSYIVLSILIHRLNKWFAPLNQGNWWELPIFLIWLGALIIPIRGGFQSIPLNQSNVYFSKTMFANHASVNFMWNFINAVSQETDKSNPYQYYTANRAKKIIEKRRSNLLTGNDSILKTSTPNILLIIWESLSAKVVGAVGGENNVTENFNKLAKEGILFTNFYGNGDRTDKGLTSILSGYYPQPTKSIIKMPNKTRSLPMLIKETQKLGYETSFYYGGDTNFGNMVTYLRNGGVDKIIDGDTFDKNVGRSTWGVHDHIFIDKLLNDLSNPELKQPFFTTALTLTSHEPYEFPDTYKFGKEPYDNLYRSAQAYTDKVLGNFIKEIKKQPWWDNTLVVIMSDHGHPLPNHKGYFNSYKKFHIPMLWLGGALSKTGIKIDSYLSQVDFSYTLMRLLKSDANKFTFGKHLFNNSADQYAHYIFNEGFGIKTKNGYFVYDHVSKKAVIQEGDFQKLDSLGKSISQEAYNDYLHR